MRLAWTLLSLILSISARSEEIAIPTPPTFEAESFYLMDFASGAVLAEGSAYERLPPASLTKLMSGYVVLKALANGKIALDDRVRVSEKAWRMRGSRMFIEVDTEVTVEDLLRGMIIQSGNDASVALAEHVAGSVESFVELMNTYAEGLGMTGSSFRNPTGLPAKDHYSTAHDSATVANAIIKEFPDYYSLYGEREFTYNGIRQLNRNALLRRDDSVDGMKTGYTSAAGYCMVSSAERSGRRLIAVVMGMNSPRARAEASEALLDYGFENFETHKLYARGEPVTEARVWKGQPQTAPFGLQDDFFITVPRGRYAELSAVMELQPGLVAPIEESAPVGEVRVSIGGESIAVRPLVSLGSVLEAGIWTRMSDGLMLWLE